MDGPSLITALYDGKILKRTHYNDPACTEYIYMESTGGRKYLGVRGWNSGDGSASRRLEEILLEPEHWHIVKERTMSDGYPYPWSAGINTETEKQI